MNSWSLVGRLTKDPDIKATKGGTQVCTFSLAVGRPYKKDETDFFDCVAFGKTAEIIADYHSKGNQIAVTGRGQQDRWEKDGQKRSKVVMIVDQFSFVGDKKSQSQEAEEIF